MQPKAFQKFNVAVILIRGLERVGISSWKAVTLSILVFIGIHFSSGAAAMMNGLIAGSIFAVIYVKTRNILPLCIAHLLIDIMWVAGVDELLTGVLNPIFI